MAAARAAAAARARWVRRGLMWIAEGGLWPSGRHLCAHGCPPGLWVDPVLLAVDYVIVVAMAAAVSWMTHALSAMRKLGTTLAKFYRTSQFCLRQGCGAESHTPLIKMTHNISTNKASLRSVFAATLSWC